MTRIPGLGLIDKPRLNYTYIYIVFALACFSHVYCTSAKYCHIKHITLKMCLKFIKLFKHELKTYTKRSMNITGNFLLKKKIHKQINYIITPVVLL